MKNTLILLLLLAGCTTPKQEYEHKKKDFKVIEGFDYDAFYVVTIDGCKYVVYHGSQKGTIIHAGNCDNHRTAK